LGGNRPLLKKGGFMDIEKKIFEAIAAGDLAKLEELLVQNPDMVNSKNEQGQSAVLMAIYYGNPALAYFLVDQGARLDIFEATAMGELLRVKQLVEENPELTNAFAADGFQPLGLASFFGHLETVEYLLSRGAEVNSASRNAQQVMPLHSAVAGKHFAIAKVLLAHGAEVNAKQAGAFTPLHASAQNNQPEMTRLLLEHGAAPLTRSTDGSTPLDLAESAGAEQVISLLREYIATK
jgi:uncharacterized protein